MTVAGRLTDLWPRLGHAVTDLSPPPLRALRAEELRPPHSARSTQHAALTKAHSIGRLNAGVYLGGSLLLAGAILTNGRAQVHSGPLETAYPAAAVAYLAAHRADLPQPVHLFHEYGWGGYLIAQGWPVFIDGRADPYNPIFDRYIAATNGNGWADLFARYGVNAVLIRPRAPLDPILAATAGWRQVYADGQAVLYVAR